MIITLCVCVCVVCVLNAQRPHFKRLMWRLKASITKNREQHFSEKFATHHITCSALLKNNGYLSCVSCCRKQRMNAFSCNYSILHFESFSSLNASDNEYFFSDGVLQSVAKFFKVQLKNKSVHMDSSCSFF